MVRAKAGARPRRARGQGSCASPRSIVLALGRRLFLRSPLEKRGGSAAGGCDEQRERWKRPPSTSSPSRARRHAVTQAARRDRRLERNGDLCPGERLCRQMVCRYRRQRHRRPDPGADRYAGTGRRASRRKGQAERQHRAGRRQAGAGRFCRDHRRALARIAQGRRVRSGARVQEGRQRRSGRRAECGARRKSCCNRPTSIA